MFVLFGPALVSAQGRPLVSIDTNLYPYQSQIDNDTDLTFVSNARFPARFSYFSFVSFRGATTSDAFGFSRSEQNIRWAVSPNLPLDLNFQAVLVDGTGNDFTQLGIGWRVHNRQQSLANRAVFQIEIPGAVGAPVFKWFHRPDVRPRSFGCTTKESCCYGGASRSATLEKFLWGRRVSCERFSPRQRIQFGGGNRVQTRLALAEDPNFRRTARSCRCRHYSCDVHRVFPAPCP